MTFEKATQFIIPLLIPCVLVIGTWFTMQSDLRHLEERLAVDERVLTQDITNLESRIHVVELDSSARLARIEAQLVSIEQYLMIINNDIRSLKIDRGATMLVYEEE